MTKRSERWQHLADECQAFVRDADVFKRSAKYKAKWQKGSKELGDPKDPGEEDDDLGAEGGVTGAGNKKDKTASTSGLKQPSYSTPTVKGAGQPKST